MVLRLGDPAEDVPQFIPRKRRKQNEEPIPAEANTNAESSPRETTSVKIPTWRREREQEERANPKTSVTQFKWPQKQRENMAERDWRIMCSDLDIVGPEELRPLLRWSELNNSHLAAILTQNYPIPTPVQRAAIQLVLTGHDGVIVAPTGSGKTLGFLVPIFESLPKKALILAPTRELAVQIGEVATFLVTKLYGKRGMGVSVLVGGLNIDQQLDELKAGPRLIIATPGRLIDFLSSKDLSVKDCDYLVFDEADRMIDMGFQPQISDIVRYLGNIRQTLMFSATWSSSEVQKLSAEYLRSENLWSVSVGRPSESITQLAEMVDSEKEKFSALSRILKKYGVHISSEKRSAAHRTAIIFVNTKQAADQLVMRLNSLAFDHKNVLPIHGNLNQAARNHAVEALKSHEIAALVATDVAARGVDIPGVALVVNYDMPTSIDTYVHRIGRTGRAGEKGRAVSLVTVKDKSIFPDLQRHLRRFGPLPEWITK